MAELAGAKTNGAGEDAVSAHVVFFRRPYTRMRGLALRECVKPRYRSRPAVTGLFVSRRRRMTGGVYVPLAFQRYGRIGVSQCNIAGRYGDNLSEVHARTITISVSTCGSDAREGSMGDFNALPRWNLLGKSLKGFAVR